MINYTVHPACKPSELPRRVTKATQAGRAVRSCICEACSRMLDVEFDKHEGAVLLTFECPLCGGKQQATFYR